MRPNGALSKLHKRISWLKNQIRQLNKCNSDYDMGRLHAKQEELSALKLIVSYESQADN